MTSTPPTPVDPASPASPILYRMSWRMRLLLWAPRGGFLLVTALGLTLAVILHGWWILPGVVLASLSAVVFVLSRKQIAPVITLAELEGDALRFRRWDGQDVLVPRRGKALRKDSAPNPALTVLQVAGANETVAFVRQDKEATAMLADLERRGVLRGPGGAREKALPPHLMMGR